MLMSQDPSKISFIVNSNGTRTHAIVPIELYEEFQTLKNIFSETKDLETRENYYFQVKGVNASGFPLGNRSNPSFMLNKGTLISLHYAKSLRHPVVDFRQELITAGILTLNEKLNCYELTESYLFTSPSFAASLVAGNNRNGLDVWVNHDGYTLKESGYGPKGREN